jgi:hypothetical protein
LDGSGNFLHAGGAGGLFIDPTDGESAIQHGKNTSADRKPEREISGHEFPSRYGLCLCERVSFESIDTSANVMAMVLIP